jgi:hypothetical protein
LELAIGSFSQIYVNIPSDIEFGADMLDGPRVQTASCAHAQLAREMTVGELKAELGAVWASDWQHHRTMTLDELRAEVLRVWSIGKAIAQQSLVCLN